MKSDKVKAMRFILSGKKDKESYGSHLAKGDVIGALKKYASNKLSSSHKKMRELENKNNAEHKAWIKKLRDENIKNKSYESDKDSERRTHEQLRKEAQATADKFRNKKSNDDILTKAANVAAIGTGEGRSFKYLPKKVRDKFINAVQRATNQR